MNEENMEALIPCTSDEAWDLLPGEGNGALLQYFCLGNPMDGGAWQATVHGVTKSRTQLSGSPTSWALILTLLPMWFVLAISHFDRGRVKRQIGD